MNLFSYYAANLSELAGLTGRHVFLVLVSTGVATMAGIPLGITATRVSWLKGPVLGMANVFQTIPSLALFGFLIPFFGIGVWTAIAALVVYALLPVVRNTYTGITGVDPAVREAGLGMGMTEGELLRLVELPLAAGVIMAGIRVATVAGVGIATIAAAIGAGGLGEYIFRGVSNVNYTLILAGALPAAVLALLADASLGLAEKRLVWRR